MECNIDQVFSKMTDAETEALEFAEVFQKPPSTRQT